MFISNNQKAEAAYSINDLQEEIEKDMSLNLPLRTSVFLKKITKKALLNQDMYYRIEKKTKIWWPIIAWLHYYFLDYKMDTFNSKWIGVNPDTISKSLVNSCYPAPHSFEESIVDALKEAFPLSDWLRNRPLQNIFNFISLGLTRIKNSLHCVGDMMTLGGFNNPLPYNGFLKHKIGLVPFINYLLDNKLIDRESKEVLLPIGFSNIVSHNKRKKL